MYNLDTNMTGLLTEMQVQQEFIKRGFGVSVPLNPSERYDLIVDAFGGLFKVQIKTAIDLKSDDGFIIYTSSVHKKHGVWNKKYYDENEVDLFATVHNDSVYVIPYSDVGTKSQITFRTKPTKSGQEMNIRNADYYELDNVISRWNSLNDSNKQQMLIE